MKLDFTGLSQPTEKARGQVGTVGTQAFMRVPASPVEPPDVGTGGDIATATVDLPAAVPAACPQVSPVCPQSPGTEKPSVGAVSPVSPVVPSDSVLIATKDARTCAACRHRLRHGTCAEPVAAGFAPRFEIRWPPERHAETCQAYSAKTPMEALRSPHRLMKAEADRCHAPTWDDAEIAVFTGRVLRFVQRGIKAPDPDDLAERLTLLDRDGDDLRLCLECENYRPGRCGTHRAAGMNSPELGSDLATMLQRCPGFESAR
jgi:hypothetical protein